MSATDRRSRRRLLRNAGGLVLASAGAVYLSDCGGTPWQARQAPKVPRIGFLGTGTREGRAFLVEGFLRGMREHGYVEGQNLLIEYRFSEDRDDRLPELAAELVASKVDLIVTSGVPASVAAKAATSTVPVVLAGVAADPVAIGLIDSLAHPGGNVTGMSQMSTQLSGKRLELFREIVPGLSRVAVFWNPPNPVYGPILQELEAAAGALHVKLQRLEVRHPEDFENAFVAATEHRAEALIVPADPLTTNRPKVVADLALKYRLPAMMEYKVFVEVGGLVSLGADLADLYRQSATHVDKILKGAKPADLPVEQSTRFDLYLNMQTAHALGLTIPHLVLVQATEVIQ